MRRVNVVCWNIESMVENDDSLETESLTEKEELKRSIFWYGNASVGAFIAAISETK